MSIVAKPNTFSANTTISSSKVNDNFDTLYDDYNGGITAANLATGAITTAKIADANVTTDKIADANVTNAKLASQALQSWTPTWVNLTVGNGTVIAKYIQIGRTVQCVISVVFGSTTSIGGTAPTFTLPVTAAGTGTYSAAFATGTAGTATAAIGVGTIFDSGTAAFNAKVDMVSSTTAKFVSFAAGGTYTQDTDVTSTVPMTWTTNDGFFGVFSFEAAA